MSTRWDPAAYQTALRFAADAHGGRALPGSTFPYVVHLANVATEVMLGGGAGSIRSTRRSPSGLRSCMTS